MVDVADATVVAVMARAPSSGGKTRLFASLGRSPDPELLRALLLDTLDGVAASGVRRVVAYTPASAEEEMRALVPADIGLMSQREGDLGARMRAVFEDLFARGAKAVVVVGSDLPGLAPDVIGQAIVLLGDGRERVVFGPAADGGYYLIAARRTPSDLLSGINWGTADVLNQSVAAAAAAAWEVALLPEAHDVDTIDELREVASNAPGARRTRAWFNRTCGSGYGDSVAKRC
jgi:rSAM/selenodomain-associated transferase 1